MSRWAINLVVCGCACLLMGAADGQQSVAAALALRGPSFEVADDVSMTPPVSTEAALQAVFSAAGVVFVGEVTRVHAESGFVEIHFRVEESVRGTSAGSEYVLREWSGLWTDGARYRVGDRRLMMLRAASVAGFASPVGGSDGVIPMRGDATTGDIDLRWIASRVARRSNGPSPLSSSAGAAFASTDRVVVMDLLHAWQRAAVAR
jgi:hypothetical protein